MPRSDGLVAGAGLNRPPPRSDLAAVGVDGWHGNEAAAMAHVRLAQLPVNEYPYLAELTAEHVLQPGYSYANEFPFGLDLVLDALERARDSSPAG